jgi:hypothetical protein
VVQGRITSTCEEIGEMQFEAIIALLGIFWVWSYNLVSFDRHLLLFGGIAGIIIYFLLSAFHLTENLVMKLISKLILGISFASICLAILIAGNDIMFMFEEKVTFLILLYMLVITILNGKRTLETYRTCIECEFKMRWSRCPGLKDIICACINEGYIHAEEKNESVESSS